MKESWKTMKLPISPSSRKPSPQNYCGRTSRASSRGRTMSGERKNRLLTPTLRIPATPTALGSGLEYYTKFSGSVEGMTQDYLNKIYKSKCFDLCIPENQAQELRFTQYCEKKFKNRCFCMSDQELGPNAAKMIGEILQCSIDFCCINLSANRIQDEGLLKLGQSIVNNSSIIHIDISSNELTPEGLKILLETYFSNESLISLDISSYNKLNRNRLNPAAAESLCGYLKSSPVLTYLELNETALNDSGFEWLIIGLCKNQALLKLGISNNNITSKHMQEFCSALLDTGIQDLNMSANKINDEGCKHLANLLIGDEVPCKLVKLDISKNNISFKGSDLIFHSMRYNFNITHFNIEGNLLGPSAGQSLNLFMEKNSSLVWFNLNSCGLKNSGISHLALGLAKNKALVTLLISNNGCQEIGLNTLCEALAENRTLTHIDLSYNLVQDTCDLANLLKQNKTLRTINLKENKIKEKSGPLLVEATKINTILVKFNLESNHIDLKHLASIKNNLKKNQEIYFKTKKPNLIKEIEKLQNSHKEIQPVFDEVDRKKNEKAAILEKIQKLKEKVPEIKEKEEKKIIELKNNYKLCREKSLALSIELEKLLHEIPKLRISEEKLIRDKKDEIGQIVSEIKALEKKSKQ